MYINIHFFTWDKNNVQVIIFSYLDSSCEPSWCYEPEGVYSIAMYSSSMRGFAWNLCESDGAAADFMSKIVFDIK